MERDIMCIKLITCVSLIAVAVSTVEGETLIVDAQDHCVFMRERQRPQDHAATIQLKPNTRYKVSVTGEAWMSDHTNSAADPFYGVTIVYCTNEQDGFADRMKVARPGDKLSFVTPRKGGEDIFLSAFFIDYWKESPNHGQYKLTIESQSAQPKSTKPPRTSRQASQRLNIYFGTMLDGFEYDAALGSSGDTWNHLRCREEYKIGLQFADGSASDVDLSLSANDGVWGITGHGGVYHAYLYHNARNVDLAATLRYLPAGKYDVLVYAHGDAPDQNAAIEILSANKLYSGKSTLNDGTWDFRNRELTEGNQYVKYRIDVTPDAPVVITSKRAGSSLSMFNAIQFKKVKSQTAQAAIPASVE